MQDLAPSVLDDEEAVEQLEGDCRGSGANAAAVRDDGRMPQFVAVEELFKGRHFDREVVVLCVRWYLSFKLSYRDGSGANLQVCEIRWVLLCEMEIGSGYAARAACQISGIVAVSPPSLLM